MTESEIIDILRQTIVVIIKMSGPIMLVALLVGLAISLFQALTQIQEMTLAFVPKIMCVFVFTIFFLPVMLKILMTFSEQLFDKMISLT